MTIDRRADYIAVSRPATLDRINDIQAGTDECRRFVERGYHAHIKDDWAAYLHFTGKLDAALIGIRRLADAWAGEVSDAPAVAIDQLEVWSSGIAA